MKKSLLFLVAVLMISVSNFAQNLILWDSVAHFLPPDTILIKSGPVDAEKEMQKYIAIKNNSTSAIPVCLKKVVIDTVPGSKNYFCWSRCYPDYIYHPTDTVLLPPQKTEYFRFTAHYRPMDKPGNTTMRYVFYDKYHPSDSVSVRITFNPTGLGTTEMILPKNSISASPNPADDMIRFTYSISPGSTGKIMILQITGTILAEKLVQGAHGTYDFDCTEMKEGLYFYYLMIDGKVCSAKKLVIKH